MLKAIATAIFALAATSASAYAQDVGKDPANDGKTARFVKNGAMVEIYNKAEGLRNDGGPYILIKVDQRKDGDAVYRIKNAKSDVYLSLTGSDKRTIGMQSPVISRGPNGGKTTKDLSKITTWILHLNSGGWSIMPSHDGALAVSRRAKDPATNPLVAKTDLQRNQGAPTQVWMIKQIGFAVNPEL